MSKSVDERVVEMRFDNKQFEKGIDDSIKSLQNLKKSLKTEDAAKGLKNLEAAGKKFSLSNVTSATEAVTVSLSKLGTVGDQIIRNLVNKFDQLAGKAANLVKSMSTDQIAAGWEKYESNASAVRTIMNATGLSVDVVDKKMEKLLWYSDETSYSFDEMSNSVAKFVNAGASLDDAIDMAMGIANWGASAGQGYQQVSSALYNTTQAFSKGNFELIDWRSIQNANMNTKEFQRTVLKTAEDMGYLRRMADGTLETMAGNTVDENNFTDALSEGWFDKKVLESVLKQYANFTNVVYDSKDKFDSTSDAIANISREGMELGAKALEAAQEYRTLTDALNATKDAVSTGWMTTFKLLFGNMEDAKELWTELGETMWDVFASGSESRNEMLEEWREKDQGKFALESLKAIHKAFINIRKAAAYGWNAIFPKKTADDFLKLTDRIKAFFVKIGEWSDTLGAKKTVITMFKGLASAVQIVKKVFQALLAPFKAVGALLNDTGNSVGSLIQKFFGLFTTINESEGFNKFITGFGNVLSKAAVAIVKAIQWIIGAFKNLKVSMEPLGGFFAGAWAKIKEVFQGIGDFFSSFAARFKKDGDTINNRIEEIAGAKATTKLGKNVEFVKAKINPFVVILDKIKSLFEKVKAAIDKVMPYITETLKRLWELFNATISAATRLVNEITFKDILAGGLAGGGLKALWNYGDVLQSFSGMLDSGANFFSNIGDTFGSISDAISGMSKSLEKNVKADTLKKIAKAVLILAIAVLLLASIEPKKLLEATGAVVVMLGALTGSGGLLSKGGKGGKDGKGSTTLDPKQMMKVGTILMKLAKAILILAVSLKIIASIDAQQMAYSVAAVSVLMYELVAAVKILSKSTNNEKKTSEDLVKVGVGLKLLASAIKTLARSVAILAKLDPKQMALGVAAIGVLMGELIGFVKATQGVTGVAKIGLGMLELAAALGILSIVVVQLGKQPIDVLVKGLAAIGIAIMGIAGALKVIPKDAAAKAGGLIVLSAALEIIAHVVKKLGSLDLPTLVKGLTALGIAVVGITGAMRLMPGGGTAVAGASAFMIIVLALDALIPAFKIIGSMSWESITKGVVALGAAVAGIAGAMKLMPGGGTAVAGASAFLLMAVAIDLLTASLMGLSFLPVVGIVAGLGAIAVALGILVGAAYALKPVEGSFVKLAAGMLLMSVAAALFSAAMVGIGAALMIVASVGTAAMAALISAIKMILVALPSLLETLAASISKSMPAIVTIIGALIKGLLDVIRQNVPLIVQTFLETIIEVLTALADNAPAIVEKLFQFLVTIFDGLKTYIPVIAKDVALMLRGVIDAVLEALEGLTFGDVVKAIAGLAGLTVVFTELAVVALLGLATSAMLKPIANNLNAFIDSMQPFLEKIQEVNPASLQGAEALANMVMTLTKASILEALTSWFRGDSGGMVKFGEMIAQLGPYIKQYADSISGIDADAVLKSALAAQALAGFANNLPREGGWVQKITGETDFVGFVEGLVDLGPALKAYAASVTGLDAGVVENSIRAASTISAFANNLPRNGGFVQDIIGENSLNQFAQDLTVFGPNLMAYAKSVEGLPTDVIETSITAATVISEFASKIPNQGGLLAGLLGDNTLSMFGAELVAFGPLIAEYAESVSGIDAESITASGNAAKALAEAATAMPADDGLWQKLAGHKDLASFAEGLVPFGEALAKYSDSISGENAIDLDSIETATKAMILIFEAASEMPNQGGVISWFAGDNKIADFAKGLDPFADALHKFDMQVRGIKLGSVKTACKAMVAIFEAAEKMPNQGGVISWFMGDNKIGDFAEGLDPFADALKKFADKTKNINVFRVTAATTAMTLIFTAAANMPNQGGIISWFQGDNKLSTMGDELQAFGPKFAAFGDSIKDIMPSKVMAAATSMSVLFGALHTMPNQGGIISWFQGDNTLGKIGEDLEVFGPAFAWYASAVKDFESTGVDAATGSLTKLFEALGSMPNQGGVISWFQGDNTLGKIGEDLAVFGPEYAKFARSMANVGIENLQTVEIAFTSLKGLTEALSVMPDQGGVVGWFNGDQSLSKLAEGLGDFGEEYKAFAESVTGFEELQTSVDAAIASIAGLGDSLHHLPDTNGMVQKFFGEKSSLVDVGKGLKEFGEPFVAFSTSVQDIGDFTKVESAFTTIAVLGDSLSHFPDSNGMVQKFFGEKSSLQDIGTGLSEFGPKLVEFTNSMVDTDLDKTNAALALIEVVANGLNAMPEQDGKVQEWLGEKSFSKLGEELPGLGEGLRQFGRKVKDTDLYKVQQAVSATIDLIGGLGGLGDVRVKFFDWFDAEINTKSLANFGEELSAYGESLVAFDNSLANIQTQRVSMAFGITKIIIDTVNLMEPLGGWEGFWNGEKDLKVLGNQIASLGGYLASFDGNIKGIVWQDVRAAIDEVYRFINLGKAVAGVDFSGYWNFSEALGDLSLYGAQTFIDNFKNKYDEATEAGETFISNVKSGIETKCEELNTRVTNLANDVIGALNSPVYNGRIMSLNSAATDMGLNLVQGLINGMNTKRQALIMTAQGLGTDATNALRNSTEVHSPSRITYEIGDYLVQGLVNGMRDNTSSATDMSNQIGSEVLLAMQQAIASVMAIMESDDDLSPVIRPVVDLSDARKQAGELNGMFGSQAVAASGFTTAAKLNRAIQNGAVFGGTNTTTNNNSAAITFNIYGGRGQNAQDIADEVQKRLKMDLDRRGYAFR